MLSNLFAGGSTQPELMDTLNRIAPECPECGGKRLHFCIEQECEGSEPFCLLCQHHLHFLHRKNELRMLFVDRAFVSLASREAFQRADRLAVLIAAQKKRSKQLIEDQLVLLKSYSHVISQLEELKADLTDHDPMTVLYGLVRDGIHGRLHHYRDARDRFLKTFRQLKLKNRSWQLRKLSSVNDLLKTLNDYTQNPLNIVEGSARTIADCIYGLLNERSQMTTVEQMLQQTNLEKFISQQDPPVYWNTADYSNRSRRCRASQQQKSKASRLIVEADPTLNTTCEITVRNTLKELTLTSELVSVARFPEHLQKLVLVMLPTSITSVTQRLPPSLKVFKATVPSSYWAARTPYALKNMPALKYLVLRDFGMKASEARQIVQFSQANQLRVLAFLKDEPKVSVQQSRVREGRPEASFAHSHPRLQPHYLVYRRKVLQAQRIHRSKWILSSKVVENMLEALVGRAEHAWERNEELELAVSRRASLDPSEADDLHN